MKCPYCGYTESKVIDSRPTDEYTSIRRRRECLSCQRRFTTYEIVDHEPLMVQKKDGSMQMFDRSKLLAGMIRACDKLPISRTDLEQIVNEVETELQNSLQSQHTSRHIGVLVMEKLKKLNAVAYVRFASVHREFKDLESFMNELEQLKQQKEDAATEKRMKKQDSEKP